MTEDLLEEQSEVLSKLGTSAEGAQLRARMQSACLLSDMESFKVRRCLCVDRDDQICVDLLTHTQLKHISVFFYKIIMCDVDPVVS